MKANHNLFVVCNLICIVCFVAIPIYAIVWRDYEFNWLIVIVSALIELHLIDELIKAIKENNK